VFVLVVGTLGIWLIAKQDDDRSVSVMPDSPVPTSTTTETTTERAVPPKPSPENPDSFDSKLIAVLPRGYDAGVCQPVHPPATGALATVDCGAASPQGGPPNARYSLFADQAALDKAFDDSVAADSELVQCPDSRVDSPTTWHFTETPDKVEGRIACGVYNGNQDVAWTVNKDMLLGDAQGPNLVDLHNWWLKFA